MQAINSKQYESEVLKSEIPVVLDFSAKWCNPCKVMHGVLEKLEAEYTGKVKFLTMDVEENSDLVVETRIRSVPTIRFIKKGVVLDEFVGSTNGKVIKEMIDELL